MTDKVQKNQIADILLDFYDEYDSNVINRPMIPNIYAGKILDSMQEEPVSEDLEEEASRYAKEEYSHKSPATLPDRCIGCYAPLMYAFKAGAKWQEGKDKSITEDLGKYINELSKQFPEVSFAKLSRIAIRVAKWQKEQIMAKAIDGEILEIEDNDGAMCSHTHLELCIESDTLEKNGFKDNNKVKVIVIKED